MTDAFPGDPKNGVYVFEGAAQGDFTMAVRVTTPLNTYVFNSVSAPPIELNKIQVTLPTGSSHTADYVAADPTINGSPLPATSNGSGMSLGLQDSTRKALANDALPSSARSLASFDSSGWFLTGYTSDGVAVYGLNAQISSITAVPEPATLTLIAAVGLVGVAAWRRTRSSV